MMSLIPCGRWLIIVSIFGDRYSCFWLLPTWVRLRRLNGKIIFQFSQKCVNKNMNLLSFGQFLMELMLSIYLCFVIPFKPKNMNQIWTSMSWNCYQVKFNFPFNDCHRYICHKPEYSCQFILSPNHLIMHLALFVFYELVFQY